MQTSNKIKITIEATVEAPVSRVWECWNEPEHITQWAFASNDWHAPKAENDLRVGGAFSTTMAAKDGSFSFDFAGVYDAVEENKLIEFTLGDGRKVSVSFTDNGESTYIVETFEAEEMNSPEMQQAGWQAILNNFKKYVERS
ncbi:MAG TPA: SRPBCC family protein [Parasegetibacter sp.]